MGAEAGGDGAAADGARWRIGTVPYRVAKPLTDGLAEDPRVALTVAPPARLADLLRTGELDVALASSVLAVGDDPLPLWKEGPVIASFGPVRSVLLLLRPGVGPSAVRSWVADPHSRTGQALAGLALSGRIDGEVLRLDTDGDPFAFADEHGADAVQVIGDPALRALVERPDWGVVDLGEVWHVGTGLPFVFAGWVAAPGGDPAAAAEILDAAAERGLARRAELAAEAAAADTPEAALGEAFFRRYLLEDMLYRLPEGAVAASLAAFEERLAKFGL